MLFRSSPRGVRGRPPGRSNRSCASTTRDAWRTTRRSRGRAMRSGCRARPTDDPGRDGGSSSRSGSTGASGRAPTTGTTACATHHRRHRSCAHGDVASSTRHRPQPRSTSSSSTSHRRHRRRRDRRPIIPGGVPPYDDPGDKVAGRSADIVAGRRHTTCAASTSGSVRPTGSSMHTSGRPCGIRLT